MLLQHSDKRLRMFWCVLTDNNFQIAKAFHALGPNDSAGRIDEPELAFILPDRNWHVLNNRDSDRVRQVSLYPGRSDPAYALQAFTRRVDVERQMRSPRFTLRATNIRSRDVSCLPSTKTSRTTRPADRFANS